MNLSHIFDIGYWPFHSGILCVCVCILLANDTFGKIELSSFICYEIYV